MTTLVAFHSTKGGVGTTLLAAPPSRTWPHSSASASAPPRSASPSTAHEWPIYVPELAALGLPVPAEGRWSKYVDKHRTRQAINARADLE